MTGQPVVEQFLCDVMLGRLARWLRLLGYDTIYERRADDRELLARAVREGRVLLTRDTGLAGAPGARVVLVRSGRVGEQLGELAALVDLSRRRGRFSRCTVCNEGLDPASPELVARKVPDFVQTTCTDFRSCPTCGRVYWRGTHRKDMERRLARFGAERRGR